MAARMARMPVPADVGHRLAFELGSKEWRIINVVV